MINLNKIYEGKENLNRPTNGMNASNMQIYTHIFIHSIYIILNEEIEKVIDLMLLLLTIR